MQRFVELCRNNEALAYLEEQTAKSVSIRVVTTFSKVGGKEVYNPAKGIKQENTCFAETVDLQRFCDLWIWLNVSGCITVCPHNMMK